MRRTMRKRIRDLIALLRNYGNDDSINRLWVMDQLQEILNK